MESIDSNSDIELMDEDPDTVNISIKRKHPILDILCIKVSLKQAVVFLKTVQPNKRKKTVPVTLRRANTIEENFVFVLSIHRIRLITMQK